MTTLTLESQRTRGETETFDKGLVSDILEEAKNRKWIPIARKKIKEAGEAKKFDDYLNYMSHAEGVISSLDQKVQEAREVREKPQAPVISDTDIDNNERNIAVNDIQAQLNDANDTMRSLEKLLADKPVRWLERAIILIEDAKTTMSKVNNMLDDMGGEKQVIVEMVQGDRLSGMINNLKEARDRMKDLQARIDKEKPSIKPSKADKKSKLDPLDLKLQNYWAYREIFQKSSCRAVLGLTVSEAKITEHDVDMAFRKMSKQSHPDKGHEVVAQKELLDAKGECYKFIQLRDELRKLTKRPNMW